MLYLSLKYLHMFLAVVAVGFNASYPIWLARARTQPDHALMVLRGIKTLDDRCSSLAWRWPSSAVARSRPSGSPPPWCCTSCSWSAASPSTRRPSNARSPHSSRRPDSPEYLALGQRGTVIGLLLTIDVLAIVFLMVVKPTL